MISSKLLKIIFGVLLVVIVIELTFLFYNLKLNPNKGLNTKKLTENKPRITKTGQPFHESVNTSSPEYQKVLTTITPAIHPSVLNKLEAMIKSENGRIYILQELKKTVIAVEPKGACVEDRRNGVVYPGEICFPFAIKVEDKVLPEGYHWIYFTEKNIKQIKVFIKTKNGNFPSSLQQIQPGDIILIIDKWDPSIPFDINQLKEYLDKQLIEQNIYIINRKL